MVVLGAVLFGVPLAAVSLGVLHYPAMASAQQHGDGLVSTRVEPGLRGLESRPVKDDPQRLVNELISGGYDTVTVSLMHGTGYATYPSEYLPHNPEMDPDFLPDFIAQAHANGISVIGWVSFNIQNIDDPDDFELAKRFPEYVDEFLPIAGQAADASVGMDVICSPYRDWLANVWQEAAALGVDGIFFDGFYIGGLPQPFKPGGLSEACRAMFREETGYEAPGAVDWTSDAFKAWVRWRNEKLVETAEYFTEKIHEIDPSITVIFNYNTWPYGDKDWETGLPLWHTTKFAVSQHAYGRGTPEWVMVGFKARLAKDLTSQRADIWRPLRQVTPPSDIQALRAAIEEFARTLSTYKHMAFTYGVAPWHSGRGNLYLTADRGAINAEIRKREPYFATNEVAPVGVVVSQNTFDFYGHIPGTENLALYKDAVIGTYMVLTQYHVPFRLVFDNQLDRGELSGLEVLIMPNTAALSFQAAEHIRAFVDRGGVLVATQEASQYDEWGNRLSSMRLGDLFENGSLEKDGGLEKDASLDKLASRVLYLPEDPGVRFIRTRDRRLAERLVDFIKNEAPWPVEVDGPPTLIANTFTNPEGDHLFVNLLNVSHFVPGGDTGFRGYGAATTISDRGELAPARDVSILVRADLVGADDVNEAYLVAGETRLPVERVDLRTFRITVPEIGLHEIVEVTLWRSTS